MKRKLFSIAFLLFIVPPLTLAPRPAFAEDGPAKEAIAQSIKHVNKTIKQIEEDPQLADNPHAKEAIEHAREAVLLLSPCAMQERQGADASTLEKKPASAREMFWRYTHN